MFTRSKEQDLRTYTTFETYSQSPAGTGTAILQGSHTFVSGGSYKSLFGYDHENFHDRQRRGELLPYTPFKQEEYSVEWTLLGHYDNVYLPQNERWWHTKPGPIAQVSSLVTLSQMQLETAEVAGQLDPSPLVQACAAKVYASGHDSLTFLSELHKVGALFKGLTKRAKRLIETVSSSEAAKRSASAWLEYRYAWRTLVFDMQDLNKQLQRLDDKRKRFTDRVGSSHVITATWPLHLETRVGWVTYEYTDVFDISMRGSVTADINPPKFQFNPVLTGWELLRFSFIVDWFIGVGTWLEALSFQVFASNYVAAGGYLITHRRNIRPTDFGMKPEASGSWDPNAGSAVLVTTHRSPQTVPFRPFANINLDVFKVVDLVAIFSKTLRGFAGLLRI